MRHPLLRAGGAAMGQRGLPHSLEAPTIGAGNPLVSHKTKGSIIAGPFLF